MIDIEALGTNPDATILTIAAVAFDPFNEIKYNQEYYARIDFESQENRSIQETTLEWWATQNTAAKNEAFAEDNRIPLGDALDNLAKLITKADRFWAQGPTYDMTIIEHAYKSLGKHIPWRYSIVRDTRTVFSLWPDLKKPETSHNAIEDCWRQIELLQQTLAHFNISQIK